MIKSHGQPPIRAFFIQDGAVGDDLSSGYAISGYQGNLLSQFCKSVKLPFDNIYKTLLIKEELPTKPMRIKADEYVSANAAKVAEYGPLLIEEINELNPYLVIPLGELSFNFLTSLRGIRKFRGSILPPQGKFDINQPNLKVLPILGPYPFINEDYKQKFITQVDFQKIEQYLNERPIPDNYYKIWVARTAAALRAFLDRSYDVQKTLVFDIETYKGIPTCISFCFDGFESVCIPLLDTSIDLDNRSIMFDLVNRILKSEIRKVNQNIKFDWKILARWGFTVNNIVGDTAVAANCLYCEFPKNLGFLTSIYTDLPYFKDEGKEFDPARYKKDQFYLYNAKDSLATHQVHTKQQIEIQEQGVKFVYDSLISLIPIYKNCDERGLKVSEHEREILKAKYNNLFEIELIKLHKLTGDSDFNPLSHKQCNRMIFNELEFHPVRGVKKTKSGGYSTDEDSIAMLRVSSEAKRSPVIGPIVLDYIINARKLHKVIEILNLPLWPDGRFRCDYNTCGAETGRSTAGQTLDELIYIDEKGRWQTVNLGHSLQTIGKHGFQIDGETYGKDIRRMFVPTPGYRFVEIDLSGAEARVDAVLAGIFDLSYFDNPGIHKLTGSWCFDCAPDEIKKGQLVEFSGMFIDRYHVAKQVRHAGERNIQPAGLVTKLLWGFSVSQGATFLKKFHAKQPEIQQVYHKEVKQAIDQTHCLIAPNGRRRDFFDRITYDTYNEGYSQLPQAIVADQTRFHGVLKTCQEVNWAFLVEEAHDGTLWEVPNGREEEFSEIYTNNVQTPIDFRHGSLKRNFDLVIPAETEVGENWFEMKGLKC